MKKLLLITALISPLWLTAPTMANQTSPQMVLSQTQTQLTAEKIREACANQQVEKLPEPFSDVSKDHWAYPAVANLYYCQIASKPNSVSIRELQKAPTSLTLNGRSYQLETYIWRNFIPGVSSGNEGMIASVRLKAQDGKAIPSMLIPDKLWVIKDNGKNVWETTFSDKPRISSGVVEMVARSGPNWQPGSVVDVVIRLNNAQNQIYFLRASSQKIQSTF
ncbi:MAG: hypothetical protein ACHBN1_11060 [Heteroscytonema crispum UTEX LB 1556]